MIVVGNHLSAGRGLLTIPKASLLHHTAFIGQSGSGKSFAIARLLEEIILRTKARVVVLDPNGDFDHFYLPMSKKHWTDPNIGSRLTAVGNQMPAGIQNFEDQEKFHSAWTNRRFQFLLAGRKSFTPYRSGANAAPLKIHWKWLGEEQDFLLRVDPIVYPKVHLGMITCFRYTNDNAGLYTQGYSLDDLEDIAESFASKRIAMASYPEALALSEADWMAVVLQFRQLRKGYHRLWYEGMLKEQITAPNDLSNYIRNGFRANDPWQSCIVGLAGMDVDHMQLAANVALHQVWKSAVGAWQYSKQNAAEYISRLAESERSADEDTYSEFDRDLDQALGARTEDGALTPQTPVAPLPPSDRRVPTFIVIDEAHNFAPREPTNPMQQRVSDKIATIASEGRKYGLFLILATQRPQKLRNGLMSECENGCLLRIQSKVERDFAAEALGVPSETVSRVGNIETGEALMTGRWVSGTPECTFAPARTTQGGSGIDPKYWCVEG